MLISPTAIQSEVEARTGFPVEAESISSNPMGVTLSGRKVRVGNPPSFGGGPAMLEIESFNLEASLPAMGRGEIWIDRCEIHISRATLVVDERGRLNLQVFMERLFEGKDGQVAKPFFAESVRLTVDELTFIDNSRPVPAIRSIRPLLDVELRDLKDSRGIFSPIMELGSTVGSLPIDPLGSTLAR